MSSTSSAPPSGPRAITQQLLAFSRRQVFQPQVLDLNALLQRAEPILRRTLGERSGSCCARRRAGPGQGGPGPAGAGPAQPGVERPRRHAERRHRHHRDLQRDAHADYAASKPVATIMPGPHVLLSVSDTGTGMDGETVARVFEPFFTTKPRRRRHRPGSGNVYGIVKQSGGYVWVYSEPGLGTTSRSICRSSAARRRSAAGETRPPSAGRRNRVGGGGRDQRPRRPGPGPPGAGLRGARGLRRPRGAGDRGQPRHPHRPGHRRRRHARMGGRELAARLGDQRPGCRCSSPRATPDTTSWSAA